MSWSYNDKNQEIVMAQTFQYVISEATYLPHKNISGSSKNLLIKSTIFNKYDMLNNRGQALL